MDAKHADGIKQVFTGLNMVAQQGYDASDVVDRLLWALGEKDSDDVGPKVSRRLRNKLAHAASTLNGLLEGLHNAFLDSLGEVGAPAKTLAPTTFDDHVRAVTEYLDDGSGVDFVDRIEAFMHPVPDDDNDSSPANTDRLARSARSATSPDMSV
jgi:hypothetical protein